MPFDLIIGHWPVSGQMKMDGGLCRKSTTERSHQRRAEEAPWQKGRTDGSISQNDKSYEL